MVYWQKLFMCNKQATDTLFTEQSQVMSVNQGHFTLWLVHGREGERESHKREQKRVKE